MGALNAIHEQRVQVRADALLFPAAAGFFFVFRSALTVLFFQSNPVGATALAVVVDAALLFIALLWSAGEARAARPSLPAPMRWIYLLLAYSLATLLWTGAQSKVAAAAYWMAMAADALFILILTQHGRVSQAAESILMGTVWGGIALAVVAWLLPLTSDMRLGNEQFLHPNTLGLAFGLTILVAQYLARRGSLWTWLAVCLAVTLLRTLSKTSIIAFLVAEAWYILVSRRWSRKGKSLILGAALLTIAFFWSLLSLYFDAYANTGSGTQVETLTGRTVIWATSFAMALETPWFGHGVYSFKSLIPPFGIFAPVEAHNELLQQFFEYGLAGVFIVIGIYTSYLRFALKARASELKLLAIALWIFAVVHGIADTVAVELSYQLWLMTTVLLYMAASSAQEDRK